MPMQSLVRIQQGSYLRGQPLGQGEGEVCCKAWPSTPESILQEWGHLPGSQQAAGPAHLLLRGCVLGSTGKGLLCL